MDDLFGLIIAIMFPVLYIAFIVIAVAGMWKTFAKAGQPGWASIIPFYNSYVMMKVAGRPGWWFLLLFVPFVNFVVVIIVSLDIAKAFGKSAVWGFFMLIVFNVIGYVILGFGDAQYQLASPAPVTPAEPVAPAAA